MMNEFLFNEFNMVAIKNSDLKDNRNNTDLIEAVTVVEELMNLGFIFDANDTLKIATLNDKKAFLNNVKALIRDITVEPMYPDFPNQVMSMDEATYRFHQLIHYFSNYIADERFGDDLDRFWLPKDNNLVNATAKTMEDKQIVDSTLLRIIDEKDINVEVFTRLCNRKERLTNVEQTIIKEVVTNMSMEELDLISDVNVSFKENLTIIGEVLFDTDKFVSIIGKLCQHTGDVWKVAKHLLATKKWHFKTSEKKKIIKVLESFNLADFKANLVLSINKSKDIITILEFLSYNNISKSDAHKEVVRQLRNKELHSWESYVKQNINTPKMLEIISERPGMALRWMNWMLTLGYTKDEILNIIDASGLSTQTLLNNARIFSNDTYKDNHTNASTLFDMSKNLIDAKLSTITTEFKDKKVYFDSNNIYTECSNVSHGDKSPLVGMLKTGMAYKFPEEMNSIRFFTYWNDSNINADVDLHASCFNATGESYHIGWNDDFKKNGVCTSGDITHANAAEYIDIDLTNENKPDYIILNIEYYSSNSFTKLDTCFCGILGINNIGEEVKLYNPKNCFISSDLTTLDAKDVRYAIIDTVNKCIYFDGNITNTHTSSSKEIKNYQTSIEYSLKDYINSLFNGQNSTLVETEEEADVLVSIVPKEGYISLIDKNFYLDN